MAIQDQTAAFFDRIQHTDGDYLPRSVSDAFGNDANRIAAWMRDFGFQNVRLDCTPRSAGARGDWNGLRIRVAANGYSHAT